MEAVAGKKDDSKMIARSSLGMATSWYDQRRWDSQWIRLKPGPVDDPTSTNPLRPAAPWCKRHFPSIYFALPFLFGPISKS